MDETTPPSTESEARTVVANIARTITDYRDDQHWGILRVGSSFVDATTLTSLFTFLILVLALTRGATVETIVAAAAFYLVGALAGLFKRLHAEAQGDASSEDYNFTGARLWRTPVLSGLAALGGVVIISMAPALVPQPTPQTVPGKTDGASQTIAAPLANAQATPQQAANQPPKMSLDDIFNLPDNAKMLVLAAAFGLTPGLVLGRLQQVGDRYKDNLSSTETA